MPTRKTARAALAIAVVLVVVEALAYTMGGHASWLASRMWAAVGLFYLGSSLVVIGRSLFDDLRRLRVVALVMLAVTGSITFWGIDGVDHALLNLEACHEVADGLVAYAEADWRYTGTGFIHYPARQYLVTALPTLALGRGLATLRLGYALPFVIGVLLCHAGLKRAWAHIPGGHSLAAVTMLALFGFPYLVEYLRFFEQIILPVSLVLNATGWLLLARDRPTLPALINVMWIGSMLATSYTPGLAAWLLLLAALASVVFEAVRERLRDAAVSWLSVSGVVLVFGALSFMTRNDANVFSGSAPLAEPWTRYLREAFSIFLLGDPRAFVSPLLALPVYLFLVLAMVGRCNRPSFVIAWWTVGVVAAAAALQGYAGPPPTFSLHRALVVVPPLVIAASWTFVERLRALGPWRPTATGLAALSLLLAGTAAWNLRVAVQRCDPSLASAFHADVVTQARDHGIGPEDTLTIVVDSDRIEIANAPDAFAYFFPNHFFIPSTSSLSAIVADTRPLMVYADRKRRRAVGRAAAAAGADVEEFTFEHFYHPYEMVRLVLPATDDPAEAATTSDVD